MKTKGSGVFCQRAAMSGSEKTPDPIIRPHYCHKKLSQLTVHHNTLSFEHSPFPSVDTPRDSAYSPPPDELHTTPD
ncbi:hypothetical protein NSPZN2_10232 [Nitrospira defluvii]|uniref:Uncharacterized protein n=1 Tax=Nitrospira defluvii TaxID=330214 RepID=A0ABM8QDG5_9BACT|nr:hypothetical protein NSPZN2_10232 [Nitrospira defluvii]